MKRVYLISILAIALAGLVVGSAMTGSPDIPPPPCPPYCEAGGR